MLYHGTSRNCARRARLFPFPARLPPASSQLPRTVAPPATILYELSTPALSDGMLEPSARRNLVANGPKPPCSGRAVSRCSGRPSACLPHFTAGLHAVPLWPTNRALPRDDSQANRCENHARGSLNLLILEVSYPLILANRPATQKAWVRQKKISTAKTA